MREKDLKLFIKVSRNVDSSIVVLEGDYVDWNNSALVKDAISHKLVNKTNHTVVANELIYSDTNVPLKNLRTKPNILIACIGRKREVIIPNGNDCMMPGDIVVVVTKEKKIRDITDILE